MGEMWEHIYENKDWWYSIKEKKNIILDQAQFMVMAELIRDSEFNPLI